MSSYSINFISDERILLIQYHGKVDIELARKSRAEASSIAKGKNIKRILLDGTESVVELTTLEQYELNTEDPQVWGRNVKMAFVFTPSNWDDESARFSDNVAVNMGMNRNTFNNRDDAITWLLED